MAAIYEFLWRVLSLWGLQSAGLRAINYLVGMPVPQLPLFLLSSLGKRGVLRKASSLSGKVARGFCIIVDIIIIVIIVVVTVNL